MKEVTAGHFSFSKSAPELLDFCPSAARFYVYNFIGNSKFTKLGAEFEPAITICLPSCMLWIKCNLLLEETKTHFSLETVWYANLELKICRKRWSTVGISHFWALFSLRYVWVYCHAMLRKDEKCCVTNQKMRRRRDIGVKFSPLSAKVNEPWLAFYKWQVTILRSGLQTFPGIGEGETIGHQNNSSE